VEWLLGAALVIWILYKAAKKKGGKPAATKKPKSDFGRRRQSTFETGSKSSLGLVTQKVSQAPARWINPGEVVEIGGFRISSGMIYVGSYLPTVRADKTENCLIDPTLPISRKESDRSGQWMPYWPSYSTIQPSSRRAYLEWLANGRTDPEAYIGYVFLFFYGLERRYFVDKAGDDARLIADEVRRLLTIYGGNRSFHGYANRFLDVLTILETQGIERPAITADLRHEYEIPASVRVYLGRRLLDKLPLDAEDALLWFLSSPDTGLRTPAVRCFEEFVSLWKLRFQKRHPNGLRIRVPKTPLAIEYRAASGTFEGKIDLSLGNDIIPDIGVVSAPLDGLRDLANECADALDPYSRLLGRKPEARGSVEAAILLPKELKSAGEEILKPIRTRIESVFGGRRIAAVKTHDLLSAIDMVPSPSNKLSATDRHQISTLLDQMDIGFEPDRRYGSPSLTADGMVVLFKHEGGAPTDNEKAAYKAAKAIIEVTALAAAADDQVAPEEFEAVGIESLPDLTLAERTRLLAYQGLIVIDAPRQQAVINKLARLDDATRRRVAQAAVGAVMADGHALPAEVKFLEKLYRVLGYARDDLYAALHRGSVVIDEAVPVAPWEPMPGTPIPTRPAPIPEPGIRIDTARLERLQKETSAVSSLLAQIFVEEEETSPPPQVSKTDTDAPFSGLDGPHGRLLQAILSAGSVDRAEFEDRARSLRLLPDGAFETLNEWGFENFDEPILEGDDPVTIADHLRANIEAMEVKA